MRQKYLGDEYDEAENGDNLESKKNDNPEGLSPYEEFLRQKYLGDEYDEAEYGNPVEINAGNELRAARKRFAKASVAVETHFFKRFFGGKKRQEELDAASEKLKLCELECMRLQFAKRIEEAKQDPDKHAELAQEVAASVFKNMQKTSKEVSDMYDGMLGDRPKYKKAAAKLGEWLNKGGKISQWVKQGGAGAVTGFTAASVAAWPITTAVGLVSGLGVAGVTKQHILEEHRGEDRIADSRLEFLEDSFVSDAVGAEPDYIMGRAIDMSVGELRRVSMENQDSLRRRVRSAMGKFGIGFAVGGFAANMFKSTIAGAESSDASAGVDNNTSQSGDVQAPPTGPETTTPDGSGGTSPAGTTGADVVDPSKYEYPWDFAIEKFGSNDTMGQLRNLADKAVANGHVVEWFSNPDGTIWMTVDGSSATSDVIKVLSKYI